MYVINRLAASLGLADSCFLFLAMVARLNNLGYPQSMNHSSAPPPNHPPNFNPRSVSFDIRSPEELAAVNEFLITLGRDVSNNAPRVPHHQPTSSDSHPGSFFDAASLSQLGLAGMPGIPAVNGPGSGAGYHGDSGYLSVDFSSHHLPPVYPSRSSHQSVQPVQFGGHPAAHEQPIYASQYTGPRMRGQRLSSDFDETHPRFLQPEQPYPRHGHYLTPPLDGMPHSAPSPHSAVSTPSMGTPPHLGETASMFSPDGTSVFDYLGPNKAAPAVQLAPLSYGGGARRTSLQLKTAPSSVARPAPVEPKLVTTVERGLPAKFTPKDVAGLGTSLSRSRLPSTTLPSLSKEGSLYPLLTAGDEQYKLAPLKARYRSPSPPTSEAASSPVLSRASTVSPTPYESRPSTASSSSSSSPRPTVLPSIHEIAEGAPRAKARRRDSDDLARAVGKIELEGRSVRDDPAQREVHARLVRDLLVSINMEYRKKFGTPPADARYMRAHEEARDVEMVGA